MLIAITRAVAQLSDPALRRVLWLAVAAAVFVFVVLWTVVAYLLANTALFASGWLEWVVDFLGVAATAVLTWLLFPGVISAAIAALLDSAVATVEARHYPSLQPAPGPSASQALFASLRFFATFVVLNLLILVFLVFPPVFPFVFYGMNGYLLGREYFELVALRRVDREEALAMRSRYRSRLFLFGMLVAFLLTVPIVNLVTPVVAAAAMVHLFMAWRDGAGTVTEEP